LRAATVGVAPDFGRLSGILTKRIVVYSALSELVEEWAIGLTGLVEEWATG